MNQEQLFKEWGLSCDRLKALRSVIQNDFNKILHDKYVTREDIKKSSQNFSALYLKAVTEISILKSDIDNLLNNFSE